MIHSMTRGGLLALGVSIGISFAFGVALIAVALLAIERWFDY